MKKSNNPTTGSGKPISVVATRIVQEALKEDVELTVLSRLAETNPGFATRVVSSVNSGTFGISRKVTDVKQACSMLGVRGLRNLALSLVVSDMVPTGADGNVLLANSLRRAVAAKSHRGGAEGAEGGRVLHRGPVPGRGSPADRTRQPGGQRRDRSHAVRAPRAL